MSPPEEPARLFIAVPVSAEAKRVLAVAVDQLRALAPSGVRWVDPEGIHLTLKFLGNVAPSRVADIAREMAGAVAQASPFPVHLAGLGVFPNPSRPRVVWAGVDTSGEHLREARDRLEAAMADLGFPRERRPFRPHLTLGRVRERASGADLGRVSAAVSAVAPGPAEPWLVDSASLVRSHLAPTGATYSVLGAAAFGG